MRTLIGPWSAVVEGYLVRVGARSATAASRTSDITVYRGDEHGEVLHVDTLSPASAEQRARFLKTLGMHLHNGDAVALPSIDAALIQLASTSQRDIDAQTRTASEPTKAPGAQGRALEWPDVEPWPDEVDGAALLDELVSAIRRYAVLPDGAADALALWLVHTYAMDHWWTSPFLTVHSPLKRCGKSTLLKLAAALANRPLSTANISTSALFRVIEGHGPTLLLDEAQEWINIPNSDLRGILNAGHIRRTANVYRTEGDDFKTVGFSTWAPKFIALVGNLPDMMMDRSIIVSMRRKRPDERVAYLPEHRLDTLLAPLRRRMARFVADHADALDQPERIEQLTSDRARDNWSPLLTIAREAGPAWLLRAVAVAQMLSDGEEVADESPGLALLTDIRDLFDDTPIDEFLSSKAIVEHLNKLEDRPWAERRRGQGITAAWLAKQLAAFEIPPPGRFRAGHGGQQRGYFKSRFLDAWLRYLPACDTSEVSQRPVCDTSEIPRKVHLTPIDIGVETLVTLSPPSPEGMALDPGIDAAEFDIVVRK